MKINPYPVERVVLEVMLFGIALSFGWALVLSLPDQTAPASAWIQLWFFALLTHIAIGFREVSYGGVIFMAGELIGFAVASVHAPTLSLVAMFLVGSGIVVTMVLTITFNMHCAPILRRHFE